MTTLRCTAQLLKTLKTAPEPDPGVAVNRLCDWSANVVRHGRKPFVLAVAEHSRLALLLPAAPYKTLVERFTESLPYLSACAGTADRCRNKGDAAYADCEDQLPLGAG